jgi:hypothetical protein
MINLLSHCKAVVFLIAIVVVWGSFILFTPFGHFQILLTFLCFAFKLLTMVLALITKHRPWHDLFMLRLDSVKHQLNSWCFTLWLSSDQYINSVFRGNEDHSISGRVGYLSRKGSKTAQAMEKVIDFIFYIAIGQRNHCRSSIEYDEV